MEEVLELLFGEEGVHHLKDGAPFFAELTDESYCFCIVLFKWRGIFIVLVAKAGYREGGVFYCCWRLDRELAIPVGWGILGMYTKINVELIKFSLK